MGLNIFGILKLNKPSWIKYLLAKSIQGSTYKISDLISGTSLSLVNSIKRSLIDFHILGNTVQSPENPVPIQSVGDNVNLCDVVLNSSITSTIIYKTYTLKPNTDYTISSNTYLSSIETANVFAAAGTSFTPSTPNNGVINNRTITSDSNGKITIGYRNYNNTLDYSSGNYFIKLEEGSTASAYSPYNTGVATIIKSNLDNTQSETYSIYTQQPMRSIEDVRDDFIKQNGAWYERHNIGYILSYDGETITTAYISTTGQLTNGATVQYVLAEPILTPCTAEQSSQLEAITSSDTYDGGTNIYSTDIVSPYLETKYWEVV